MAGIERPAGDENNSSGLCKPTFVASLRQANRFDIATERGEESRFQSGRRFDFGQRAEKLPGLAIACPFIAASRAAFDVLVSQLTPRGVE